MKKIFIILFVLSITLSFAGCKEKDVKNKDNSSFVESTLTTSTTKAPETTTEVFDSPASESIATIHLPDISVQTRPKLTLTEPVISTKITLKTIKPIQP